MADSSISVAVRIRPFSAKEAAQLAPEDQPAPFLGDGGLSVGSPAKAGPSSGARTRFLRPIIQPVDDKVLIFDPPDTNPISRLHSNSFGVGAKKYKDVRYAFDRVLDQHVGQEEVFQVTTKPLLDGILNGYNASVFAYGATGCGKTHTISGSQTDPGVIFLTMKELYARINDVREESEVDLRLSYLEIYNETIRDLLSAEPTPAAGGGLSLREDSANKISVVGITELTPESPEDVLEAIVEGNKRRTMSPTEANAVSSRSHAVLQVNVTQRPRASGMTTETTSASLSIIDLAGSERASATANSGARMKEGANINKSLLALGNCISALCATAGSRRAHIPYRNSKLTRLLKFSLGGNCKTVMIVCVSPSSAHYDETHNTLKYANQAKNIRTKVTRNMLNVDRHVAQYVQAIHELQEENKELKRKLEERGVLEKESEKRKREEVARELDEASKRMRDSTDNVKRQIIDKAHYLAQIDSATRRLVPLRSALSQLPVEEQDGSAEAAAERALLTALIIRVEARANDATALESARTLENSVQMHKGVVHAATHNYKLDNDATLRIRAQGDALLREVETARETRLNETLKQDMNVTAQDFAHAVAAAARATAVLKEAAGELQYRSTNIDDAKLNEEESIKDFLARLAASHRAVSAVNDQAFESFVGATTPVAHPAPPEKRRVVTGLRPQRRSNRPSNGGLRSIPNIAISGPVPSGSPGRGPARRARQSLALPRIAGSPSKATRVSTASASLTAPTAASIARAHLVASPRKRGRTSAAGSRRQSFLGPNRAASRPSSALPIAVPEKAKKAFRWADEAGEGYIDDARHLHSVLSAAGSSSTDSQPGSSADGNSSPSAAHALAQASAAEPISAVSSSPEDPVSSGTEWEDELTALMGPVVPRRTTSAAPRPPGMSSSGISASIFDRNALARRAATNAATAFNDSPAEQDIARQMGLTFPSSSTMGAIPRARTFSVPARPDALPRPSRAPFAELSVPSQETTEIGAVRSSPYKRPRDSTVGPIRARKGKRSSLPRLADAVIGGPRSSGSPRVASGPASLTHSNTTTRMGPPMNTAARAGLRDSVTFNHPRSTGDVSLQSADMSNSSVSFAGVPPRQRTGSGLSFGGNKNNLNLKSGGPPNSFRITAAR
ncbi:kinesin-domain-containing protein [Ceraceosorus bombacis]|uniref:Kinesin-domain-containing protein n=1 Tax=Ceraceosorus bombacis TaxID=401625 RepID=A0A0P1BI38_9BASI|nr:kinesin-domain-containing protein [Ceraceosorus bombacis]